MDIFSDDPSSVDTDLLAIPVFESNPPLDRWSPPTGDELRRAVSSKEFSGKAYEVFLTAITDRSFRARRLAAIGLGAEADFSIDRIRRAASALGLFARQRRIESVGLVLDGRFETAELVQAAVEGLTIAQFDAAAYKTLNVEPFSFQAMSIVVSGPSGTVREAARRGQVLGESTNIARSLANEPANRLTPSIFAERTVAIARAAGVTVETLDESRLRELGMGMLLGVGQGSDEPPRLVAMRHEPGGVPGKPVLGLVGKGITFDTGGISIKPAEGMDRMKDDMAGGAAVIGAMCAISRLKAPMNVVAVVPIAENMPGGRAMRPGDVLTSAAGKTVEVLNTDAEGRLILGDALWYAQKMGATHLVDVATLTGAISVALGKFTSGLFGTPAAWVEFVRGIAERAGDRCWPMPLFDEYKDQLKSEIADMVNTGGRQGGAITAALFLKEFTGGLPWAHLDIAGTAWVEDARPYMPKGPAGIGIRTLSGLALSAGSWPDVS